MKVSVSILSKKDDIDSAVNELLNTSCDYIHLDIMDGTFTEEKSFSLSQFNIIDKKYDIHIMSSNLDYQINEAIKLKPEYITIHYESTKEINKYIDLIKSNNIKVGLAINPNTKIYKIKKYLNDIDLVLIMSVYPGKGGQEFITKSIKKAKKLFKLKTNYIISIDGGINNKTIDYIYDYVDMVVSGSYVTNSDNYEERIISLKK